jgi:signal transduction histidine kinase
MTLKRRLFGLVLGLAVVPVTVVGALVTHGALRYAIEGARQRLRDDLEEVVSTLDRSIASREQVLAFRFSLEARIQTAPPSPATITWMENFARGRSDRRDEPACGTSVFFLSSWVDQAYAVASDGYTTRGRWIPPEQVPRVEPVTSPDSALGEKTSAGRTQRWHSSLSPTGPTVNIRAMALDGVGGRMTVIEEVPVISLFRAILERSNSPDLASCVALAPTRDPKDWVVLYSSVASAIGTTIRLDGSSPRSGFEALRAMSGQDRSLSLRGRWRFVRSGDLLCAAGVDSSTGWLIGGSTSLASDLRPIMRTVGLAAIQIVFVCSLIVLGLVLATRGIGRSVAEIARGTGLMAKGDLNQVIRIRGNDEFGTIAEHVNRMAFDLTLVAEAKAIARVRSRIMHELKGVASQLNLLLYNLRERPDDAEFRAESFSLMEGLIRRVKSLTLELRETQEEGRPSPGPVDLVALVRDLVRARVSPLWPRVRVLPQMPEHLPVTTDAALLSEALMNVVVNACEAMAGEGELRIEAGLLSAPPAAAAGLTHYLNVVDTGPGMPEEFIREDLFRPFATTKEGGIGLGMYHVRELMTRLGGRVHVVSETGRGTTVRMEFGVIPDTHKEEGSA